MNTYFHIEEVKTKNLIKWIMQNNITVKSESVRRPGHFVIATLRSI